MGREYETSIQDTKREGRLMWSCYIRNGVDIGVGGVPLWNVKRARETIVELE